MSLEFLGNKGTWREVANSARTTISRGAGSGDPPRHWKKQMLLAEHSPIRQLSFKWKWLGLPYWVSVHFTRHWLGIMHWVSTQRTDRTGIKRDKKSQDAPVMHECEANAQALINISRKRLCNKASPETQKAWYEVRAAVKAFDPVMAEVMVPECIYRGFCPEFESCGYANSESYRLRLQAYREISKSKEE